MSFLNLWNCTLLSILLSFVDKAKIYCTNIKESNICIAKIKGYCMKSKLFSLY